MSPNLSIEEFYNRCKEGELFGLKCALGHVTLPPQPQCRECGSESLNLVKLSGRGAVISFTRVFVSSNRFASDTPYFLVLVNLEEGGNLLGILKNLQAEQEPRHGLRVRITFEQQQAENPSKRGWPDWPHVYFVPT